MKERLRVVVTREDIQYGKVADSGACPVARALRRALEKRGFANVKVAVDESNIDAWGADSKGYRNIFSVLSPFDVSDFVANFDDQDYHFAHVPAPFEFTVPLQ